MTKGTLERRDVLKGTAAAGAMGLTAGAHAAGVPAYDPDARFEVAVSEVELRRNAAGRMLTARIYSPEGEALPCGSRLHGGAWSRKDRLAEEPMDRALASSGLVVVAVDMTLASEAPYPACVQDANYAARWLKANAALERRCFAARCLRLVEWRPRRRAPGDGPHDPGFSSIAFAGAPEIDASVSWARCARRSNTFARYENAEHRRNETMIASNRTFFSPWQTINEGNPQEILERGEKVALVPFLVMQGALDDNVLPAMQEKFVAAYRAAGGQVRLPTVRESPPTSGSPSPVRKPTRRVSVKEFIARQLKG